MNIGSLFYYAPDDVNSAGVSWNYHLETCYGRLLDGAPYYHTRRGLHRAWGCV